MVPSTSLGAFPNLHAVLRLIHENDADARKQTKEERDEVSNWTVYDVKFYPYTHPDDEAVFAVVYVTSVYVFRTSSDPRNPIEVLAVFEDPKSKELFRKKSDSSLNSLVWSQDVETGDPLICFGGSNSGDIKIINVVKKSFVRNLSGHGNNINDLAISPLTPTILASASADFSIRLWNLDPKYKHQPCAAILASPDGHKQGVLTNAFHASGKYLVSGGSDCMINVWGVPAVPDVNAGTDRTTCVHFPVFSSTEVHSNYVDCVRFHGDLILSHSAASNYAEYTKTNHILLWKIDGFQSTDPVPQDPPVARSGVYTRSAFGARFQRLLTFDMPNAATLYMRFSLFAAPGHHPVLAMGNEKSKVSFWDLQALEEGGPVTSDAVRTGSARPSLDGGESSADEAATPPVRGGGTRGRGGQAHGNRGGGRRSKAKTLEQRFDVSDAFRGVAPHHSITLPKYNFTIRQMAWSNCGGWCVAGGQLGIVTVFRRWAGRAEPPVVLDVPRVGGERVLLSETLAKEARNGVAEADGGGDARPEANGTPLDGEERVNGE